MTSWTAACGYLAVGLLWGCTNPFIKHAQTDTADRPGAAETGGEGGNDKESSSSAASSTSMIATLKTLFTKPRVMVPFVINQSGSLVYYVLLSQEPISIAAPVCNSLTFIITAVTGYYVLGEPVQSPSLLILGIVLVLIGISICISSLENK
jgi:multidrug transporter EmrE-like cation transporter